MTRERQQTAWVYVLAIGLVAVAIAIALTGRADQYVAFVAFGLFGVISVLAGISLNHPTSRRGWAALAVAMAAMTVGGAVTAVYRHVLHVPVPHPSVADGWVVIGLLALAVTVRTLSEDPGRVIGRDDYTDAAIVAVGALAVSWQFVISAYVNDAALTTAQKATSIAYPVVEISLLFFSGLFVLVTSVRKRYQQLLAAGVGVLLASTFAHQVATLHDSSLAGYAGTASLLGIVLMSVAALHPSMGDAVPTVPREVPNVYRRNATGSHRVPVMAFVGFVPPVTLLVASQLGLDVDVPVVAVICVAAFALIYLRMIWLIGQITGQTNEIEVHARALEASHQQRDGLESELRRLAFHDELTGLANRALLHDRVEHALASAPRTGSTVALCFGDLDGFKTVNDTLGHHVGDRVLVRASRLLSSIVRPGDTVARLGGDEFAVLMVDVQRPETAIDFAHRIVSVLREAPNFEESQIDLSISVGVAFGEIGKSPEKLLSEADSAMYEAKETGKNRVAVFKPSMRSRMMERLDLTNGFRWALGRSEFFLEYQPVISLQDRKLLGFEALVRWSHPTLGEVEPMRFVPLAEETGFIIPLGRWVLVEACEQLAAWNGASDHDLTLSVNLSRRQLVAPQLTEEVATVLSVTGIDPGRLTLEVTESVLMMNPDIAAKALGDLRSLGVRVAVDDFGTGYSSLSHLQRFPVDVLKIDKSFIAPLFRRDDGSAALVSSIIGLAHNLGLSVIAEGIEHESQLRRLIELGCFQGQGFLMARPLGVPAATSLITRRSRSWAAT